ncbi:cytochrome c oxidase accessory protein CcoG [Nitrogeniibacter aestuarii]|uniref:cytochrome c oxidase accessory protein CcoG n=1 Tax=Nitrogeniibacter aestuarii TaxID=2815343 RepID=UPI001E5D078E|nr:cytochrome c oxidase accessory protein CcoG [Nitrogeniibacter aestuarii]
MSSESSKALAARVSFYERTGRIHPRSVTGRFNTWRWSMVWVTQIIFYATCWLQWDGRQALLFDIAERKFYVFGLVLWPQDAMLLTLALIGAASGLFMVTALAGRMFCGFTCPQTVYSAIFRWVEARFEGDHLSRMRLDSSAASTAKIARKTGKHLTWGLIALWTGITFVGYFSPIRQLLADLASGSLGPWEGFWVFFYAVFTYVMAGFAREMVCLHMCPYARFQGVMIDADTRTISYDARRGEPRGAKGAQHGKDSTGPRGDCVDCSLCVQVCPTGIDIRKGLQYECINCGLCADACDEVMTRVKAPTGLIRFASERTLQAPVRGGGKPAFGGALRPRVTTYASALIVCFVAAMVLLANRVPLQVDVLRDRRALMHETSDGRIENPYILKIANMLETPRMVVVSIVGPGDMRIEGDTHILLPAGEVSSVPLGVSMAADETRHGAQPIAFQVHSTDETPVSLTEKSIFLLP